MSKPISDVDGNELGPPPPDSDAARLERIMMFCRRNDFTIGPYVKVGDITIQVRDLTQRSNSGIPDVDPFELALGRDGGG